MKSETKDKDKMKMTYILGINAFHGDSSACLIADGQLIAAAEEERFRRVKHWAGFPSESVRYCLDEAGIQLGDVMHIAVNSDPKANLFKKIGFMLKGKGNIRLAVDRIKSRKKRRGLASYFQEAFPNDDFHGKIHKIEHHLAHLVSAFSVSPFNEAAVVSVDGLGDFASTAWGLGVGNNIQVFDKIYFPHSLGIFYEAMTHFLGFKHYGDEYKVMGLAPYGKPLFLKEMRELVQTEASGKFELNLDYFSHHLGKGQHQWEGGAPHSGDCFGEKMADLFGAPRGANERLNQTHKDIARSTQEMYEEAFFNLLNSIHRSCKSDNLTLAGGCGMNSVANGKIYQKTPFKKVYIQSAAGDAGGAIGAAFSVWYTLNHGVERSYRMEHAYLGPQYTDAQIKIVLAGRAEELKKGECIVEQVCDENELCQKTARAIERGKVVGWFQGRMEWGPRALGNRSILGDPRREDMKDILNLKIKRRESFRPFAPSILREAVVDWFEEEDDVPFMLQVYQIREGKRKEIPAVTHVNGSGRLQTVTEAQNHRYYNLIKAFEDKSGVPILLNTSFNENEPVVCRPEEALDCFLRTKMDVLVLGNWFVYRHTD